MKSIQGAIILLMLFGPGFAMAMDCELGADYYHRAKSENDAPTAMRWLKKSVQICPNFNSWYILGLMYAQRSDVDSATAAFSHARSLAVTPRTEALALARMGQMQVRAGQMMTAQRFYELACRFHPPPVPAWIQASLKETRLRAFQHIVPATSIARVLGGGIMMSSDGRFTIRPAVNLPVHFDFNRSDLNLAASRQVYELGLALSRNQLRNRSFILVGHTDKRGTAAYNQHLSEARSSSVKDALEREFPSLVGRLQSTGRGETDLLYDGDSEIDHRLNRRVKVTVRD